MHKYFLIITFLIVSISCGHKKWPNNWIEELKNTEKNSEMYQMMIDFKGESAVDDYYKCLFERYKLRYPDFTRFEIELEKNPNAIRRIAVNCTKDLIGSNFSNVITMLELNPSFKNLKAKLTGTNYKLLISCLQSKIYSSFKDIDEFYYSLSANPNSIDKIFSECEESIIQKMKDDEERNIKDNESLIKLERLVSENILKSGSLIFMNETSKSLNFAVCYYYSSSIWQGWLSEGWYSLLPGEKRIIKVPLNNAGFLYNNFYFYAYRDGASWSGGKKILTMDGDFRIPNADEEITKEMCSKFSWRDFIKKEIINESKEYSINLTE